jgi:hypothetical protein
MMNTAIQIEPQNDARQRDAFMYTDNDDTSTLERYRRSDAEERIFLFLQHRLLRSAFLAIDMACYQGDLDPAISKHNPSTFKDRWWYPIKSLWREIFSNAKPSSKCISS